MLHTVDVPVSSVHDQCAMQLVVHVQCMEAVQCIALNDSVKIVDLAVAIHSE